jgi:hypothetical protein
MTERRGRPPKPVEAHKRAGTFRADRHGGSAEVVVALPMAAGVPEPPAELMLAGRSLWGRAWASAITWLSPDSDLDAVVLACSLADDLALARERYRATRDPADARAVVALSKEFTVALSDLGFNPTARARLGVAEVKRVSALDELLSRRRESG